MICKIKDLRFKDKNLYGAKASSLGELMNNKINIPDGFALSTKVFEEFLQYNFFPFKNSNYLLLNKEIQAFILKSNFSEEILSKIEENYFNIIKDTTNIKIAVRSSALCEDTKSFSMAGMFNSYINLDSFEKVIEAIKKCYASLFEEKVLSYAINNNISMNNLKMGIVIQEFIEGELSGVNFSADVIEMNSKTICINAVKGTCEKYVSGKFSSSLYKLDKNSGKELSRITSNDSPELSSKVLETLFNKTLEIENIFSCFQDIEWTLQDKKLYILQSRPITTFKDKNFALKWENPKDEEYEWRLGPPFPFAPLVLDICPLEEAAFSQGAYKTGYAERNMARTIQNGYIYFRNKFLPEAKEKREKFFKEVDVLSEQGFNIFQDVLQPELDLLISQLNTYIHRDLSFNELTQFLNLALEYLKKASSFHWPAEGGTRYVHIFKKYCDDLLGELDQKDFYDLIYNKSIVTREREMLFSMANIVKCHSSLMKLFNFCLYDELLFQKLKTHDTGIELMNKVENYLKEFGTCNSDYDDFIPPVLFEKPESIIRKIRSLLEVDTENFFKSLASIKKNKERMLESISKRLSKEDFKAFQKKLTAAEKAFLVTDTHNYYIERQSFGYLRLAVMKAAKALKEANIISKIEDVFFLTYNELKNVLSSKVISASLIEERKKTLEKQKSLFPPRRIGKFQNEVSKTKSSSEINSSPNIEKLKGIATFDGKIKGKIIKGIPQSIDSDCILVVFHGHSSDITHLLGKVKGLIFENGSPFDHLGIISKEMNIPAIYYVKNALAVLKNGDWVEIDGSNDEISLNRL